MFKSIYIYIYIYILKLFMKKKKKRELIKIYLNFIININKIYLILFFIKTLILLSK